MKFRSVLLVSVVGLSAALGIAVAEAGHQPPSAEEIAFAQETSDLMTATVVAALLQEIGETTLDNVEQGNLSISLIFNNKNKDMRLVGNIDVISTNDYPQDDFEEDALDLALAGIAHTDVDKVKGKWYYRRSIPLSAFATQCAYCHEAFEGLGADDYVGALMLRIPFDEIDD